MFIARAKQPVFDTALKLAEAVVGVQEMDLRLIPVMCLVFPDGRVYWGERTPQFLDTVRAAWERSLTENQIKMYSVPDIQMHSTTVWMYPRDYEQVRSEF